MKLNEFKKFLSMIRQLKRKNALFMSDQLLKYEITYEQWIILRTIQEHEPVSQKIIADITNKDKSTLTRILDQLENKNMVTRNVDSADRRSFILKTTDKGETIVNQILPVEEEAYTFMLDGISEDDIILINSIIMKTVENTDEQLRRKMHNER